MNRNSLRDYRLHLEEDQKSDNTVLTYMSILDSYCKYVKVKPCKFSYECIRGYLLYMQEEKSTRTAILVKEVFKNYLLFKEEYSLKERVAAIRLNKPEIRYFNSISKKDYECLVSAEVSKDEWLNKRNKLIVQLGYYTGLRISELSDIEVKDVNTKGTIKIVGKGRKERIVLAPYDLLESVVSNSKGLYIFSNKNGKKLSKHHVSRVFKEKNVKCSLDYTFHDLRRTFATNLLNNGANPFFVAKLLGHSNIQTTLNYYHTSLDYMIGEYKKYFE